jgi:hypothetical protein
MAIKKKQKNRKMKNFRVKKSVFEIFLSGSIRQYVAVLGKRPFLPSFLCISYFLHPFTILKNKVGVAYNIEKNEGKRAVIDYQRFKRGQLRGIKRATRADVDYQILKKIA